MSKKRPPSPPELPPEALISRAFLCSPDAIIVSNQTRKIVGASVAAEDLFGFRSAGVTGRSVRDLYGPEEDWQTVRNALARNSASAKNTPISVTLRHRQGTLFDGSVMATAIFAEANLPCGYLEKFETNTEANSAEARAAREIGESMRLARGIAHDFDNLLAIIGGNVQLAEQRIKDEKLRNLLRDAELACKMGAGLTQRIKAFAADRHFEPTRIDVESLVKKQLPLLRGTLGTNIELTIDIGPGLRTVFADNSALENALLNLALNARDAMPDGGSVTLTAINVEAEDRVRISLKDTGCGMTPRVLARAFDPFFTTKPQGRGTGLGLATVYGFAKQSGGTATIESKPGTGTTVSIELPTVTASQ